MDQSDPINKMRFIILAYFNNKVNDKTDPILLSNIHLVWFSKTLKNWKALAVTTVPDKLYYEITHDGSAEITYLDVYKKINDMIIYDQRN